MIGFYPEGCQEKMANKENCWVQKFYLEKTKVDPWRQTYRYFTKKFGDECEDKNIEKFEGWMHIHKDFMAWDDGKINKDFEFETLPYFWEDKGNKMFIRKDPWYNCFTVYQRPSGSE